MLLKASQLQKEITILKIDKRDYESDALAGATITGDGVSAMIKKDLKLYFLTLKTLKNYCNMGLLSKKDSKLILDPLADNNPITIQVLGICSALAITRRVKSVYSNGSSCIRFMDWKCCYFVNAKYHSF